MASIEATGPSAEIERDLPNDIEVVDARGRVVLPGFVDAHAHPVFGGNRVDEFEMRARGATYEEIAAREAGFARLCAKRAQRAKHNCCELAQKRADWFLRCGTTTMEAKSGYGLSLDEELKILRVIRQLNETTPLEFVPTFLGAHAIPEEFAGAPEQYVALVIHEMLPTVAEERLAESCDIFCERGYFDLADSEEILKAAREHGLRLRMHVDQLTNSGGAFLAARFGAATADHLEQTNDAEIAALAEAGVQPVLLPAFGLCAGQDSLSESARHDRGRSWRRARDRFQSRLFADSFDSDGSLARRDPDENDARRRRQRHDDQRRLQSRPGRHDWLTRARKVRQLHSLRLLDYREIAYWFGFPQVHSVYIRGRRER